MKSRDLKEHEIKAILVNLPLLRDKALFALGVKTGFRISELLSIRVCDVLVDNKLNDAVTVRRCNMKGKSVSRTVPIHAYAKAALKAYITPDMSLNGRLFPISRVHAWRILKEASKQARLSGNVSTHSMRKSFGMNVYHKTGKNIVAAQIALGHKSLASTSHYLSVEQDTIDLAILSD